MEASEYRRERLAIERIQMILEAEGADENEELFQALAAELMAQNGFTYTSAPCSCFDGGEHGHAFFCGYSKG